MLMLMMMSMLCQVLAPWTPSCPGCVSGTSSAADHVSERHACVHLFARVYGYMPLLFTPYVADSHPTYA